MNDLPYSQLSHSRGNKLQFRTMAGIRAKIGAALLQLDEMQLEEPDSASNRYKALADIKADLDAAKSLVDGRLDLIERVDSSKVGWLAATAYEKANGPLKKADSDKAWAEAEKAVSSSSEFRRKSEMQRPFRDGPATQAGEDSFRSRSPRGMFTQLPFVFSLVYFVLLSAYPGWFIYSLSFISIEGMEKKLVFLTEISNFFGMT